MDSILLPIHPRHCDLIIPGVKLYEMRKSRPKGEDPFKCIIYCTLNGTREFFHSFAEKHGIYETQCKWNREKWYLRKGKVIGEFICDFIIKWNEDECPPVPLKEIGLTYPEIRQYWGDKESIFLWHISNLQIYDEPKELSRFLVPGECTECKRPCYWFTKGSLWGTGECDIEGSGLKPLTRPPQSWCHVKERGDIF